MGGKVAVAMLCVKVTILQKKKDKNFAIQNLIEKRKKTSQMYLIA